eukprot:599194-Amphidinium_carterae.1
MAPKLRGPLARPAGRVAQASVFKRVQAGVLLETEHYAPDGLKFQLIWDVILVSRPERQGLLVEGKVQGASTAWSAEWLKQMRGTQEVPCLHLCHGQVSSCKYKHEGRLVMHTNRWRVRLLESLTEPWVQNLVIPVDDGRGCGLGVGGGAGVVPAEGAAHADVADGGMEAAAVSDEQAVVDKLTLLKQKLLDLRATKRSEVPGPGAPEQRVVPELGALADGKSRSVRDVGQEL